MNWKAALAQFQPRVASDQQSIDYFESPAHAEREYAALVHGCGVVALGPRTQIELRGDDRAAFLHNLSTNEIRKLPDGRGCEAFLLNAQGKILFLVTVLAGPEVHLLDTVGRCKEPLLSHLDRYLIREKVALRDRSEERCELLMSGPKAASVLAERVTGLLPSQWLAHTSVTLGDIPLNVVRTDWLGTEEFLLVLPAEALTTVFAAMVDAGSTPCGAQAMHQARIERGTPWAGIDVTEANLPQEVARDARTLSFTKGCYIGQETVARIDALGHVNRTLVGVRFSAAPKRSNDTPPQIMADGKPIGQVTSWACSPRLAVPLALAYVRAAQAMPGCQFDSQWGPAEVVPLPVTGPISP